LSLKKKRPLATTWTVIRRIPRWGVGGRGIGGKKQVGEKGPRSRRRPKPLLVVTNNTEKKKKKKTPGQQTKGGQKAGSKKQNEGVWVFFRVAGGSEKLQRKGGGVRVS